MVWVTARESDAALAFSPALLRTDPGRALIAWLRAGEAPVGLALAGGGRLLVVADSNRFGRPGAAANLAVVDVAAALAHRPALPGYLRSGLFPRDMTALPGGQVVPVSSFGSAQLP